LKIIKDNKGLDIQVDDEDYESLNKYNWNTNNLGYASTPIMMHRLIMNAPKDLVVDHIDRNPRNNQKSNLRICTQGENNKNRICNRTNKTGYKGVAIDPHGGQNSKYRTIIGHKGKQYRFASFPTAKLAALMYDFWATYFQGQYAHTNFKVVSVSPETMELKP